MRRRMMLLLTVLLLLGACGGLARAAGQVRLAVRVIGAAGEPLAEARVQVQVGDVLFAIVKTGQDGWTPEIPLVLNAGETEVSLGVQKLGYNAQAFRLPVSPDGLVRRTVTLAGLSRHNPDAGVSRPVHAFMARMDSVGPQSSLVPLDPK